MLRCFIFSASSVTLWCVIKMPRKKLTIKPPSQLETLKTTPSELAKQALLKSGAGVHGEGKKRSRQKDHQEEVQATLEGDLEE